MPVELLPSKKNKKQKMCMKISRQVEALTLYCLVSFLFIFVRVDDILDSLTR